MEVDLTFTATACPCMAFIHFDIEDRLRREAGVDEVRVVETWTPAWTKARISPEGLRAAVEMLPTHDVRERLGEIAAPTLVVLGEADRTFQHEWMTALATAIPGARLQRLAGAGHLSNLEKPQEFNRALMEFLGL